MTTSSTPPTAVRTAVVAFAVDAASIVLFCAVGRRNHHEAVTLAGVAETAWPFLAGLAVSWVLYRAWRRPTAIGTGLSLWPSTIAIGMGLRAGIGTGVALAFVVVATLVTGVLLLGWRAVYTGIASRTAANRT
jgi:hypothetical protein